MRILNIFFRVARINFLPASFIPYLIGISYAYNQKAAFSNLKFVLGSIVVIFGHFAGNLFNEYFDYKSGADVIHNTHSPFFGGSKAINDGIIKPLNVFYLGILTSSIVLIVCGITVWFTGDLIYFIIAVITAFFTHQYTAKPLRLAYNKLGEIDIFLLFGTGIVLGAYYLITGHITFNVFMVSLPIGFLIMGVILCNEVPDFDTDIKAGKFNLISLIGKKNGYILYFCVISLSALSLIACVILSVLPKSCILCLFVYPIGLVATNILRKKFTDMKALIIASENAVLLHALVGVLMISLLFFKN